MGAKSIRLMPGVTITNDRCLILDEGPTAVIGDLHLGYESALENEGMFIPRINTNSVRDSLNRIIDDYEPDKIVLLGDIKHDFSRSSFQAKEDVRDIVRLIKEAAGIVVVKGNHDNFIQTIIADLGVTAVDHTDIMGFRLEHGHIDSGIRPVIIGHEHPSVKIPGELSGSLKLQCYVWAKNEGVLVIPPFSPFASGNDLNPGPDAVMAPALRSCNVEQAEVYGVSDLGLIRFGQLEDISRLTL